LSKAVYAMETFFPTELEDHFDEIYDMFPEARKRQSDGIIIIMMIILNIYYLNMQ
jgi:hypothetical protein